MSPDTTNPNQPRQIRIHKTVWDRYEALCDRVWNQKRGERVNDHIRTDFETHGTPQEVAAIAEALGTMTPAGRPRTEPADTIRFDQLRQLAALHKAGVLTDTEHQAAQARVLR